MKRIKIMSRAMAAIAILTTLAMTACTNADIAADITAAAGGDHPGVKLTLNNPTVTVANVTASATSGMSRAAKEEAQVNSVIFVELIDKDGYPLKDEYNAVIGANFGKWDSGWVIYDHPSYNGLYVTGGAGTYRVRAWGTVCLNDQIIRVAQIGTMKVTDNGDSTGTFTLNLEPMTAAVKVVLLADNGAELTNADGYFGCAFTGMAACYDVSVNDGFKNISDEGAVTRKKAASFEYIIGTNGTSYNIVPGNYPSTWEPDGHVNYDPNKGSDTDLIKIYKSTSIFNIHTFTGKPGNDIYNSGTMEWHDLATTDYTTYTVKATKGTVKLEAGKLTTLTIRVGAKDATLQSVEVSELTDGDLITGYVGDGFSLDYLAGMSADEIAKLGGTWVVNDVNFDASRTWNGTRCTTGYMMLAEMMESYYDKTGKSINLMLPKATTEIGDYYFSYIKGNYAYESHGLKSISAPNVPSVGGQAFASCKALTNVNLPSATTIKNSVFLECNNLTTVNLPMATTIGNQAFSNCPSLTTVNLPMATTIGTGALSACTSLIGVSLPAATSIGERVFESNSNLTNVNLPVATTIGAYAFASCKALTGISLPAATSIGNNAFAYSTNLTSLTFGAPITVWGERVFHCRKDDGTLTVVDTKKIDLTLSKDQKITTGGGISAATFGTETMTESEAAKMQFAGYDFKSITLK